MATSIWKRRILIGCNARLLSSFAADMTRNLKVKVVAFDLSLILVGSGDASTKNASSSSSSMNISTPNVSKFDKLAIDNELLASMEGLDGDANVHRHAAPAVDAPHTGKLITHSVQSSHDEQHSSQDASTSPNFPSRKISKEELAAEAAKSAAEYKHKYADKIKMKAAKQAQAAAAVPGGGNILNIASRWLLKEGMGDVLDYTYNRTVKIAVMGGYDRSNVTIAQLRSQLNSTQLSFVRSHPLGEESNNKQALQAWTQSHWNTALNKTNKQKEEEYKQLWESNMVEMEVALNVKKAQVLFVSGDEAALVLARERGYYTCRYTGEEKRYGQITTDFKAEDPPQIKDSIDGLIGIALRHSVSFIPFR